MNYMVAAAKKVTGVFRIFLPRQRKSYSKNGVIDDSTSISQASKLSSMCSHDEGSFIYKISCNMQIRQTIQQRVTIEV